MGISNRFVFVVEDDASLRVALERVLSATEYEVLAVSSAEELLHCLALHFEAVDKSNAEQARYCILMDVGLGGMNGIEAQLLVKNKFPDIPIVFMSGESDAHSVNQAWRDGAYDFIFKPFQTHELISLVERACEKNRTLKNEHVENDSAGDPSMLAQQDAEELTPRELQVLRYVAEGNKNQTIADVLGISLRTVKMHRANLMRKLHCTHVAELVRFYERTKGVS
jgi:FixJ family two-component response regulator